MGSYLEGSGLAALATALAHRLFDSFNRNTVVGEDICDLGKDARLIGHLKGDLVASVGAIDWQNGEVCVYRISKARPAGYVTLCSLNQVTKNCRCGLNSTGTGAIEHQ